MSDETNSATTAPDPQPDTRDLAIAFAASAIAGSILDDILDRRGLRQAWEAIDGPTQDEILERWLELTVAKMRELDGR